MSNKIQQNNFFRKTPFFIWVALAYFSTYFFYLGYFHYLGIPQQLVDVTFDDLLSLGLAASLVIIFLIITMDRMLDVQEPSERGINYIVFFLLMSPGIALSWWVKFSLISVVVFILLPGLLVFSIFSNRKNFDKERKDQSAISHLTSLSLVFIVSFTFAFSLGYGYGLRKTTFLSFQDYAIVKRSGLTAIALTIDENNRLGKTAFMVSLDNQEMHTRKINNILQKPNK